MSRTALQLLAVVLLAGCAAEPPRPGTINDDILRQLESSSTRKPAATPEEVNRELLPPLRAEMPRIPDRPMEPRFDLVVNNAPARELFNSIVSGTRYSMLIHPDVSGTVSVNLKDVTVLEALESLREVYGYEYKLDGSRIYVLPAGLQTRVFQVNYLIGLRAGRSDVRVSSGMISGNFTGAGQGATPSGAMPGGFGAQAPGAAGLGLPAGAAGQQAISAIGAAALGGASSDSSRVSTVSQSDFWSEISVALRTLIGAGEGRNVVVSPQSGVVVIRAMPQEIRSVEAYLQAMRVSVGRQVMIEAKIIEVTLNQAYQAGINWAVFSTGRGRPTLGMGGPGVLLQRSGELAVGASSVDLVGRTFTGGNVGVSPGAAMAVAPGAAAGLFSVALQAANFAALLNFLESQGTVQVLSSPRIATLNNQKAVLKVGTDEFFVTNITGTPITNATAVGAATTGVQLTPTFNSFFSGVSLDITPQIDADGNILLHIHPLVSAVKDDTKKINFGAGVGNVDVPLARSDISETDTIVRAQDGIIVALGGLMKVDVIDNRAGLPGAQDWPGIGAAFRNTTRTSVKKELVILLKPTIIKSDKDWEQDLEETRDRVRSMQVPAGR